MALIKRIIISIKKIFMWLIELFREIFFNPKRNRKLDKNSLNNDKSKKKNKGRADLSYFDEELPSYMILSDHDKEKLLYNLSLMKSLLEETNAKRREIEEKKLIKLLEEKYDIKVDEIPNHKTLENIVKNIETEEKKEIINTYDNIVKRDEEFKVHLEEVDKVIEKISTKDISIVEENEINDEITNITSDKNINEDTEEKIDYFNKNIYNIIENVDEYFLRDVEREYNKINYVTVSTMIIDKKYERFKKLEEDFKNHKFNRSYYEREINKIKHELNEIKKLKNKKEVSEHIEKLKKELYTKSKDKYDLLYNNEIFMNFDKECDNLLDKLNAKVIDIKKDKEEKKEEVKEEEKKEDRKDKKDREKEEEEYRKQRYLDNVILRFQDMSLARQLILMSQIEDNELINLDNNVFVNHIFEKYNRGIDQKFNFDRNKQKTELVILYNEINMVINKEKEEPFISIDHINFRMEDLVEAVEVKKNELMKITNIEDTDLNINTDDKIKSLVFPSNEGKKKTV